MVSILLSNVSFLGHLCAIAVGYLCECPPCKYLTPDAFLTFSVGLGYLKVFVPPEKILRWIEGKLNLLGRLPHYVSVDQKTFGRYGVLPTTNTPAPNGNQMPMSYMGSTQRLGS